MQVFQKLSPTSFPVSVWELRCWQDHWVEGEGGSGSADCRALWRTWSRWRFSFPLWPEATHRHWKLEKAGPNRCFDAEDLGKDVVWTTCWWEVPVQIRSRFCVHIWWKISQGGKLGHKTCSESWSVLKSASGTCCCAIETDAPQQRIWQQGLGTKPQEQNRPLAFVVDFVVGWN